MRRITRAAAYTTGQVAGMCEVAPRTVTKWVDTGLLKGYRLPGSKDRRIPHAILVAFLEHHGMPVPSFLVDHETITG